MNGRKRADMTTMTTYDGTSYFWAYEYRQPMRDLTPAGRRRVHALMVARGLEPVGESKQHAVAIRHALNSYDRARLRRIYGEVAWAWWDR